ncbi:MAG: thiolase family protein [Patescibacteria group bacterium]
MNAVYVVGTARSPIASVQAGNTDEIVNTSVISSLSPVELGEQVLRHLIRESSIDPMNIQFFFMGSAISQKVERSMYQAPAKFVFRRATLGQNIPVIARTVEKACSTGLVSIWCAAKKIIIGKAEIAIAGGVDMMSRQANGVILNGLTDPTTGKLMAQLADQKALELGDGFGREAHDACALASYERAKATAHDHALVPIRLLGVEMPVLTYDTEIEKYGNRLKVLSKIRPYPGCKIMTVLNSAKYGDAAAFLMLASENAVREKNLRPLARIVAFAEHSEEDPKDFIIAPAGAAIKALAVAGLQADEIDYWEINEAFPTSSLYVMKKCGVPHEKINPCGGAIAHGHPIGATGGCLAVKNIMICRKMKKRYGIVVVCNAISEATAMIFEMV